MGRLIAILLGGAALALFVPVLLSQPGEPLESVAKLWEQLLGQDWYNRIVGVPIEGHRGGAGAGIFAGLALILLAVRGRD